MIWYEVEVGIETKHSAGGKRFVISRHAENKELPDDVIPEYALGWAGRVQHDLLCCGCERVKRTVVRDVSSGKTLFECDDVQELATAMMERREAVTQ